MKNEDENEKVFNEQLKVLAKSLDDNFLILTKDRGWVFINELEEPINEKQKKNVESKK